MHKERGAIGMKVVGYAVSSTDEHGSRRIGRDMDKNALLWLIVHGSAGMHLGDPWDLICPRLIVSGLLEIDFMGGLAKLQLKAAGRVPEWRDLLLVEGGAGAGRTLAGSLQHHQATLVARLLLTGAGSLGSRNQSQGASRAGNRYALPSSPRPLRQLSRYIKSCATLTIQLVQKIGQTISPTVKIKLRGLILERDNDSISKTVDGNGILSRFGECLGLAYI